MLDKMIDFLNKILKQDKETVNRIFLNISVPADQDLIDHPTIQVAMDDSVRLIGMLNGFLVDKDNNRCLRMVIDDETNTISRFEAGEYR